MQSLIKLIKKIGHFKWMAACTATSILRTVRDLACLITIARVTDIAISGGDMLYALIAVAVAEFGGIPVLAADTYCCERYRVESEKTMTLQIAGRIRDAKVSWMDTQQTGDLISTATADVDKVARWQSTVFPNLVRTCAYLVGGLAYCLTQSALLTLCVFPVILCIVPAVNKISAPLKRHSDVQRKAAADSLSGMQEVLSDPELVKGYALEAEMDVRMEKTLQRRRAAEERAASVLAGTKAFGKFGSYFPSIFTAAVGAAFFMQGRITVGFLFGFVQMVSQRFGYIAPQLADIFTQSYQTSASAERICGILEAPTEQGIPSGKGAEKDGGQDTGWEIQPGMDIFELRHVSFAYPHAPSRMVLHDISLKIRAGERVALVGGSGSGKSTLLKLILGFYAPTQGEIYFCGRRMDDADREAVRMAVAPVFQSSFLFSMSIRDNLHVFDQPCPDEKIVEALEEAGLGEMVKSQPQGTDTVLAQRGSSLSGGQRQRMAIARAYLKDAPVMVLDEPTSAMDSVTQAAFKEVFDKVSVGKTCIMVSHRWSVLEDADRIYRMENGRVTGHGTFREMAGQAAGTEA